MAMYGAEWWRNLLSSFDAVRQRFGVIYKDDWDTIEAQLTGWSCPWAVHQHINGSGVRCSWEMTRYVTLHG